MMMTMMMIRTGTKRSLAAMMVMMVIYNRFDGDVMLMVKVVIANIILTMLFILVLVII